MIITLLVAYVLAGTAVSAYLCRLFPVWEEDTCMPAAIGIFWPVTLSGVIIWFMYRYIRNFGRAAP